MKTHLTKKLAFAMAMKRAKQEGHEMMVIFHRQYEDMVVRRNIGQKMSPDQVMVAKTKQVIVKDRRMDEERAEWQVKELKHGLELK